VTHITQDPPPDPAKAVDTIDYSPQPNQAVRQSTASDRPNQQQENPNQGGGQAGSGVSTGIASGDAGDNIEYDYTGDPYRRTLRQYERRGERASLPLTIRCCFRDFTWFKKQAPATIPSYGGRYLTRGGATEVVEGDWVPNRVVILEFPNRAQLKAW